MATEVIDWDLLITINGQQIETQELTTGTPTAVGPLTVTVDNGQDIGDVRSGSATLTVAEYGSQSPRTFRRGHPVLIRAVIGGGDPVQLYSGFIGEAVMTQVSHYQLGRGVQTQITLIDMLDYVRGYVIDLAERFEGDLQVRFPALEDLTHNLFALLRERVPKIEHDEINFSPWQAALIDGMDYVNPDGSTTPAVDALDGYLASKLLVYIDAEREYDVRGALELLGTVMVARAAIQGDTVTTKLARAFAGDVYTIPEGCITGLSSVASRMADYWDGITARIRREHENDGERRRTWDWTVDEHAPGRTRREYDWHDQVVDSVSRDKGNWTTSVIRHLAYAPRSTWRATDLTVLLDQFGKLHGAESITNLLRSVFDVLDGKAALPTINVPTDSPLMRATGTEVAGVVEAAVLTIDPPSRTHGSRAKLNLTLGPGDMRPGTNTTAYHGPRWADATYRWGQAPHVPFGRRFIQEPQP